MNFVRAPCEGDMDKIELDPDGLRLLGSALLHKRRDILRWRESTIQKLSVSKVPPEFRPRNSDESYQREITASERLEDRLSFVGGPADLNDYAQLGISSFGFNWCHLYDHQILAIYLKPRLPGWNSFIRLDDTYDGNKPIVDWGFWGRPLDALESIFFKEVHSAYFGETYERSPRSENEKIFALLVSDLVNPPDVQPKGRKKGSSPNQHHWDEIEPIYFALRKAGGTKNGSAKQALKQLNLEILPRSPDLSSAKSAYIATDERSALNSIVVEMDKREISRAL
ncbi:MAG: hypothetical protein CML60_12425 [Rhodobacteraceae bacterium]|nr:hypothetical protein [Paracoccaceae bacterium]MBT27186.1 hypothetical protein [Paracoccaceae bacterium]